MRADLSEANGEEGPTDREGGGRRRHPGGAVPPPAGRDVGRGGGQAAVPVPGVLPVGLRPQLPAGDG